MELHKAISLFLGEHKPSTQQAYRYVLCSMRDWLGPRRELADIRPEMLLEYFQKVIKRRAYSAATETKHAKTVKTFWNFCVHLELIERSPAKLVRAKKPPRAVDRHKAMTDDELLLLLEAVREKPRDRALLLFLADTGCRRGGAAGLRLQDLDLKKLVAVVTEKGEKERKVAFGEDSARALVYWLGYRSKRTAVRDTYVFSRDGKLMKAENVSLIIRRACLVAGVRVLSSHSLRHRKGFQLSDARISPATAATVLGHSSPSITMEHYFPYDWATAEQAMRELMTDLDQLQTPSPKVMHFKD